MNVTGGRDGRYSRCPTPGRTWPLSIVLRQDRDSQISQAHIGMLATILAAWRSQGGGTMATHIQSERFALRSPYVSGLPDGAWWPRTRRLGDELADLFALWPPDAGRISRVLYSPPDWDDHPHSVPVPDRWVKTGCFPQDDTHQLTLTMREGGRLSITVIPSDTSPLVARRMLADFSSSAAATGGDPFAEWENDGGHP